MEVRPHKEGSTLAAVAGNGEQNSRKGQAKLSPDSLFAYTAPPPKPPDGGYGWVVVAAAFFVDLISDGVAFTCGVYFSDLMEYFGESHGKTALIGSLFNGTPLLAGPLCAVMIRRFGCRKVTIMGTLLTSFGFIISYWATSVAFLCVSVGIVAGLGLSLVYMPALVMVSHNFDKRRALATGISGSGSGIGTFLFAPLVAALLNAYSWRGTMLVLGAIILNLLICGALFRPYESPQAVRMRRLRAGYLKFQKRTAATNSIGEETLASTPLNGFPAADRRTSTKNSYTSRHLNVPPKLALYDKLGQRADNDDAIIHSVIQLPTYMRKNSGPTSKGPLWPRDILLEEGALLPNGDGVDKHPPVNGIGQHSRCGDQSNCGRTRDGARTRSDSFQGHSYSSTARLPGDRRAIFSLLTIAKKESYRSCPELVETRRIVEDKENGGPHKQSCKRSKRTFLCSPMDSTVMSSLVDFNLITDWRYIIFFISNVMLYTWYDTMYIYLPDYGREMSVKDPELLMSVLGITNTIGQILIGWVGDMPRINTMALYAGCMVITGLVTCVVTEATQFWTLALISAIYGLAISANYSLLSIIIVELFSLDQLACGYGLMLFGQGIANYIGPVFAGYLRDISGDYTLSFRISGIFIALSGLILLPIMVQQLRSSKSPKNVTQLEVEVT